MKARAVTVGVNLGLPWERPAFATAAAFCRRAREAIQARGVEVQTCRIAGGRLNPLLRRRGVGAVVELALALETACLSERIDFGSIGCLDATALDCPPRFAEELTQALGRTDRVFASVLASRRGRGINREGLLECARAVLMIAGATRDGFETRRFAVGAGVPPNGPFFPTAYHGGGPASFSIALEAADVAWRAFGRGAGAGTARLASAMERLCRPVEEVALRLEADCGVRYVGIDLSPAPAPGHAVSIAGAIEKLGRGELGTPGTLSSVRQVTEALREVKVRRCGFSGVMLPVLEDSVLMARVAEGKVGLDQLLLYAAVCGTGLDTVPLPGDISAQRLAAVMEDVCRLSLALDKPLTARLMPVPGKNAGDWTGFDYPPYFGNTRVMHVAGS